MCNMEGRAIGAAAFPNIYSAASTAGAIRTGGSLDESERSVLSMNQPEEGICKGFLKTHFSFKGEKNQQP